MGDLAIRVAGGIVTSDLDDRHLGLGGERDHNPPSIEVDGAEVRPRRRSAQRVVRRPASFVSKALEDPRQLCAENHRHLLGVIEHAYQRD